MKTSIIAILALAAVLVGFQQVGSIEQKSDNNMKDNMSGEKREAVFAGGCFWCTESDFEKVEGVIEAISGYTGGKLDNPTYKEVSGGGSGHIESVKVIYDPGKISYATLLDIFWRTVNPTDGGGQFVDRGDPYRSAIFYTDDHQRRQAESSKANLAAEGIFDDAIATDILPLGKFFPAEDYHQDYYKKNPVRYKWYRSGSGRDRFLEKVWADRPMDSDHAMAMEEMDPMDPDSGMEPESTSMSAPAYDKPDDEELRQRLTPLQYKVVRENGTETAFRNEYWDNHKEGIYVDIVSGEPLFSSIDKFKSGTGWPSFTKPLEPANVEEKTDTRFFITRTEVRSRHGESHLGHLFGDGPRPTGLRYCINSASLRFVEKKSLEEEGYGQYADLFS